MQDPENAWVSPCALPYLAFAPAVLVLLIVLGHLLGPFFQQWRPKWTRPFLTEKDDLPDVLSDVPLEASKESILWTLTLLAFSAIGFAAEAVPLFPPHTDPVSVVFIASWVCRHCAWT